MTKALTESDYTRGRLGRFVKHTSSISHVETLAALGSCVRMIGASLDSKTWTHFNVSLPPPTPPSRPEWFLKNLLVRAGFAQQESKVSDKNDVGVLRAQVVVFIIYYYIYCWVGVSLYIDILQYFFERGGGGGYHF